MSDFISELARYHEYNPDPDFGSCRNTGSNEDGVVFLHIEPLEGSFCFVGRTSLIEGVADMYKLTPAEVTRLLDGGTKAAQKKLAAAEAENKELRERLDSMRATLAELAVGE